MTAVKMRYTTRGAAPEWTLEMEGDYAGDGYHDLDKLVEQTSKSYKLVRFKKQISTFFNSSCTLMPQRFTMAFVVFLGSFYKTLSLSNASTATMKISSHADTENMTKLMEKGFHGELGFQEILASSSMWLMWVTPLPSAILCRKIGGVPILTASLSLLGIMNLISPSLLNLNFILFIVFQVLTSLVVGFIDVSTVHLLGNWSLTTEISKMGLSQQVGILVANFVTSSTLALNFIQIDWIFWITGTAGILFCVPILLVGVESPEKSLNISDKELKLFNEDRADMKIETEHTPVPWLDILKSLPVWAITIAYFSHTFFFHAVSFDLTEYIVKVLGMTSTGAELLKLGADTVTIIFNIILAVGFDWIINRYRDNSKTRVITRKLVVCVGFLISSISLVLITADLKNDVINFLLIIMLLVSHATGNLGIISNILDIAPQYAGITKGLINNFVFLASLLSPFICSLIVTDANNSSNWNITFYIHVVVLFLGGVFYGIFAKADIQEWAAKDPEENWLNNIVQMETLKRAGARVRTRVLQKAPILHRGAENYGTLQNRAKEIAGKTKQKK